MSKRSARSSAPGVAVWTSPEWQALALAWIDGKLASVDLRRTGEVRSRVRPWAAVLEVPTTMGPLWFKAAAETTAFEIRLYDLFSSVGSASTLLPLATDPERGWMILPHGGPSLGALFTGDRLVAALRTVLPRYGELQLALAPREDELIAAGVADMRPGIMPRRFDEAIAAVEPFIRQQGSASERDRFRAVSRMAPTVKIWSARLAALSALASLDHNDLHPWNVLASDDGDLARAVFFDWGDSVVAHPFASMLMALGFVRDHVLACPDDDPRLAGLRDAYLEPFAALAPHRELVETVELACRLGKVARALTWDRAVRSHGPDQAEEDWARAPIEALLGLADQSHLGHV